MTRFYAFVAPLAIVLLGVPLAAADPPADAFCVILFEPNADFSMIRVIVDEDSTLEERAALWPSVDVDRNGVISVAEKNAFRWSHTRVHQNQTELGVKAVTLSPDAPYTKSPTQRPIYAATWRQVGHVFHHRDYELPERLTSTAELETQEVREFGFELEPGRSSRFTLSGGTNISRAENLSAAPQYTDLPKPVVEYVVIRAPADWIVASVEGHSYNGTFRLEPREESVDVPAFDTAKPYNITFLNPALDEELGKIDGVAGPGPYAAVLAVAAGVWLVRRRT